MTIKNLNNIRLNFKIKTFKLKDEFKISRVSKKIIKVIDISLQDSVNSTTAECVPYQRYNERLDDILKLFLLALFTKTSKPRIKLGCVPIAGTRP